MLSFRQWEEFFVSPPQLYLLWDGIHSAFCPCVQEPYHRQKSGQIVTDCSSPSSSDALFPLWSVSPEVMLELMRAFCRKLLVRSITTWVGMDRRSLCNRLITHCRYEGLGRVWPDHIQAFAWVNLCIWRDHLHGTCWRSYIELLLLNMWLNSVISRPYCFRMLCSPNFNSAWLPSVSPAREYLFFFPPIQNIFRTLIAADCDTLFSTFYYLGMMWDEGGR